MQNLRIGDRFEDLLLLECWPGFHARMAASPSASSAPAFPSLPGRCFAQPDGFMLKI